MVYGYSTLTIWTVADSKYEIFVTPFVLSALHHNPQAIVCVGVEEPETFEKNHQVELEFIESHYPNRLRFSRVSFESQMPHSVRFLQIPSFDTDYVYISDVDFIVLDNILETNLDQLRDSGMNINNFVRPGTSRLTGLHFTSAKHLWSQQDIAAIDAPEFKNLGDEEILYKLVEMSQPDVLHYLRTRGWQRKLPGLHLSVFSRFPLGYKDIELRVRAPGFDLSEGHIEVFREFLVNRITARFLSIASTESWFIFGLGCSYVFGISLIKKGKTEIENTPLLSGDYKYLRGLYGQKSEELQEELLNLYAENRQTVTSLSIKIEDLRLQVQDLEKSLRKANSRMAGRIPKRAIQVNSLLRRYRKRILRIVSDAETRMKLEIEYLRTVWRGVKDDPEFASGVGTRVFKLSTALLSRGSFRRLSRLLKKGGVLDSLRTLPDQGSVNAITHISDLVNMPLQPHYESPEAGKAKAVVFTANVGNYDAEWGWGVMNNDFEYVEVLQDLEATPTRGPNYLVSGFSAGNTARSARWIKTHPHWLFPNHRYAVWMDSNILAKKDWSELFEAFVQSGKAVGFIRHSERESIGEEIRACIRLKKDDAGLLSDLLTTYDQLELNVKELWESGLSFFDLWQEETKHFLTTWWSLIESGSKRDQIALPIARRKSGVSVFDIFGSSQATSVRDSDEFVLLRHGSPVYVAANKYLHEKGTLLAGEPQPYEVAKSRDRTPDSIEIIIPIHNALAEVKQCLYSVGESIDRTKHKLVLVDDGSDEETGLFLKAFTSKFPNASVIRQATPKGFSGAINSALRLSSAEMVIVLNSDTEVPKEWISKLARALFSRDEIGIVGPLSNAASWQSFPRIKESRSERRRGQTVINDLPPGFSVDDMDGLLESNYSGELIRVSQVHGFCLAIKAEVFKDIGFFDDELFPEGFGEEVDFCFRAADAGWGLAVTTDTFVFHSKSASFGEGRRLRLVALGKRQIANRYGKYRVPAAVKTLRKVANSHAALRENLLQQES